MYLRRLFSIPLILSSLFLMGCGGGNDPVNASKDMPVAPKLVKEKEKDK